MLAEIGDMIPGRTWIALCRQDQGSHDLFARMAEDVVTTLDSMRGAGEERLARVFVSRIRAWQDFMSRENGVLGPEAEIGLYGEIVILLALRALGLSPLTVAEAWQGPLRGIQDFLLGTGAIEVKTTGAASGFPARVGSLEQLDDALISPVFLAAVRLALSPSGLTLPEIAASARESLLSDALALTAFNSRLLHAGYVDAMSSSYTRQFSVAATRMLSVSGEFPRLTRSNVTREILRVRYELDLDLVQGADTSIEDVIGRLGVTTNAN